MITSVDWSTVTSKSYTELVALPEKSQLIDLFIDHAPEVLKNIHLQGKLARLLNEMRDPQYDSSVKKAEGVFSKVIHFKGKNSFVNLNASSSRPNLGELDGQTLLTFAILYCDLQTIKELLNPESLQECNRDGDTPLLAAVRVGRFDAVEAIVKKKGDPNLTGSEACAAIALACKGKDPKILDILLTKDNINLPLEKEGMPPLWCAAAAGNEQFIDLIIEKGGDIHAKDEQENTLLFWVLNPDFAHQGSSIVRCLIKHGADIREELVVNGCSGVTAFYRACTANRLDCLDLLYFPEVLDRFLGDKFSNPLILAASVGFLPVVEYLIKKGAQANIETDEGMTALDCACSSGHLEIVNFLVKHAGSDINHVQKDTQYTPLITALKSRKIEVAKYLITQGARLDLEDKNGSRALHWACQNGTLEIVTMLLDRGAQADVNRLNSKGRPPLHYAISSNQLEIARCLVERGADHTIQTNSGSLFHIACRYASLELLQLLFSANTCTNELKAANGALPIEFAACNPDLRVAQYLIERGARLGSGALTTACAFGNLKTLEFFLSHSPSLINFMDENEESPLHAACAFNRSEVVKFLLDKQADPFLKGSKGMSALDLAVEKKYPEIIELLLDALQPLLSSSQGIIEKIKVYLPLLKYENLKEIKDVPTILDKIMREYYNKRELQKTADTIFDELTAGKIDASQVKRAEGFLNELNLYVVPFFSHFYKDYTANRLSGYQQIVDALSIIKNRTNNLEKIQNT